MNTPDYISKVIAQLQRAGIPLSTRKLTAIPILHGDSCVFWDDGRSCNCDPDVGPIIRESGKGAR